MSPDSVADPIIAVAELSEPVSELSSQQLADAEQFQIEKRRAERRAVYSLINRHIAPGLILGHRPDGSPIILNRDGTPFPGHFSLSHCRTAAAIAYSNVRPVGIDIEDTTPRLSRLADKYLSAKEQQLLRPLDSKMLLAAWTFKEAAFKSLGDSQLVLSRIIIESVADDGLTMKMEASAPAAQVEGSITFSPDTTRAIAVATPLLPK